MDDDGVSSVSGPCPIPRHPARPAVVALALCFTTALLLLGVAPRATAQSEDQVMAAFLLNFARYVEWPENAFDRPDSPVRICMVDAEGLGAVVAETVAGKTVGGRALEVAEPGRLEATAGCHVVFIGRAYDATPGDAVAALGGSNAFSIADHEGFASQGGIANFYREDNRIRFAINPSAARKAGLKISSRLLRLAKVVD
jgi:hypothetical protein